MLALEDADGPVLRALARVPEPQLVHHRRSEDLRVADREHLLTVHRQALVTREAARAFILGIAQPVTGEHGVVGRELVIDTREELIAGQLVGPVIEIVVARVAGVRASRVPSAFGAGQSPELQNILRDRIEIRERNLVVRVRIADEHLTAGARIGNQPRGARIVDLVLQDRPAQQIGPDLRSQDGRQVSSAEGVIRHRATCHAAARLTCPLVIAEEECLSADHRAADHDAEFIAVERRWFELPVACRRSSDSGRRSSAPAARRCG